MVSTSTPSGLPRSPVPTPRSSFVFALGQSGAEPALRAELLSHGLSPAFGRDGFVSAKSTQPIGVDELPAMVLGRRVCLSLGKRADVDVAALVNDTDAVVHHEHGDGDGAGGRGPFLKAGDEGRLVITLVDRAGGSFVGLHRHRAGLSPDPGGDARLVVPSTSPSRAWLKVEEAARLVELPIVPGDAVIEVGSSPGGQTRALLDRGCVVVGIDPNAMDDGILREPRFRHVRESARHVDTTQLRAMVAGPARLLVVDVNQRPMAALSSVASIIAANRGDLRGGLFTLKLGDWALLSELPAWRSRIEGLFGPGTTTVAFQLPANRVEVTVFARRPG